MNGPELVDMGIDAAAAGAAARLRDGILKEERIFA
jgi:hypothetical protein